MGTVTINQNGDGFSFQFLLQWPGSYLCNSLSRFVSTAFFRLVDLDPELGYKT